MKLNKKSNTRKCGSKRFHMIVMLRWNIQIKIKTSILAMNVREKRESFSYLEILIQS
jgi:hypothetical protein